MSQAATDIDSNSSVPQQIMVTPKKTRLTIQCDELWSFVDNKGNKKWVWLALDVNTREIVVLYTGLRDKTTQGKTTRFLAYISSISTHILTNSAVAGAKT
jgi:hypothetical protein